MLGSLAVSSRPVRDATGGRRSCSWDARKLSHTARNGHLQRMAVPETYEGRNHVCQRDFGGQHQRKAEGKQTRLTFFSPVSTMMSDFKAGNAVSATVR